MASGSYSTFEDPDQPAAAANRERRYKYALAVVSLFALVAAIAFTVTLIQLIRTNNGGNGQYSASSTAWPEQVQQYEKDTQAAVNTMKHSLNGSRMRDDLRVIAARVHLAGTPENEKVGDYIRQRYSDLGYHVTEHEYDVLLTYPDYDKPNTLHVTTADGDDVELSDGCGRIYGPVEAQSQLRASGNKAPVWFHGYAANGSAAGRLVYANYCSLDDFDTLESMHIQVEGSLVLCRYGRLWRGSKVAEAAKRGAVGVIIYSDPADYASEPEDGVWPESYQMPPSGAQRGSIQRGDGDPLTPNMSSKPYVFRTETLESVRARGVLPSIPVMPVGYGVAQQMFEHMNSTSDVVAAPAAFEGGLNASYVLTAGNVSFSLSVRSQWDERRRIRNICARLTGSEEPDQFVLFSNHYDAWTNGALDPGSGTVAQMEMARVLAQSVNSTGWRPLRSVMFCHWDAEEYMLLGSREWVEEHVGLLHTRALAVINVDTAVKGTQTIRPSGSPLLLQAVINSTQTVCNPNAAERAAGRSTVFDSWSHYAQPATAIRGLSRPLLALPGSGSDHYPFIAYAAVPTIYFAFALLPFGREHCTQSYECATSCHNLYHSMYEVPWTVEHLYDPEFDIHRAVAETALKVGVSVASSLVLPLDVTEYTAFVAAEWIRLDLQIRQSDTLKAALPEYDAFADSLSQAINRLTSTAASLQANALAAGRDPSAFSRTTLQQINQRLAMFERNWLNPAGIYPLRPDVRHVLLSSSVHDAYAGVAIASVREPIQLYADAADESDKQQYLVWIRQSLSYLHLAVDTAEKQLRFTE